jgi:hypothetical protein
MSGVEYNEWNYLESRKKLKGKFTTFLDALVVTDECYGVEWIYARGDTVWVSDQWYRCDNCKNHYRYCFGWSVWKYDTNTVLCNDCADYLAPEVDCYRYTETMYG